MASLFKNMSAEQWLRGLFIGLVILYLITQILDVKSLSSGSTTSVLNPNFNFNSTAMGFFTILIVSVAVFLVWIFVFKTSDQPRLDKTYFISLAVYGVILYVLYAYIVQPALCNAFVTTGTQCALPSLKAAAANLYSMAPQGIQSIFAP